MVNDQLMSGCGGSDVGQYSKFKKVAAGDTIHSDYKQDYSAENNDLYLEMGMNDGNGSFFSKTRATQ